MSRVQVVDFRCQTVSSRIFKSTILNCDITSELFLGFREISFVVGLYGVNVLSNYFDFLAKKVGKFIAFLSREEVWV